MLANGIGVIKNEVEAVAWYRRAAEKGSATAQNNLGMMYLHGGVVNQDEIAAAKWLRKAAEQGLGLSQVNLGLMYLAGQGVNKDPVEACAWFLVASARGENVTDTLSAVAAGLTPEQRAEAGQRAKEHVEKAAKATHSQ